MSNESGINISLFIYPDLVWHPSILDWKVTFIIGSIMIKEWKIMKNKLKERDVPSFYEIKLFFFLLFMSF